MKKNSDVFHKFCVVDLFAGVGGLTLGFIKAKSEQWSFQPVLLVDEDSSARLTFQRNFPRIPYLTCDVRRLSAEKIRDIALGQGFEQIDVVMGGPPCQGLSRLGQSRLDDPRNELLRTFVEIALELQPKLILMENVPALLTLEKGVLWDDIVARFESWGYSVVADVLEAAAFCVPQTRKRAFVLATRTSAGMPRPKLPKPSLKHLPRAINLIRSAKNGEDASQPHLITVEEAIGDLPPLKAGEGDDAQAYKTEPLNDYQMARREGARFLFNHRARKHSAAFLEKLSIIEEGDRNLELTQSERFSDNYYSQAYARLHRRGIAQTITTSFLNPGSGRFIHYRDLRSITVREAARFQSFDDTFVFHGDHATQMRHVGNAVPPVLAMQLALQVGALLQKGIEEQVVTKTTETKEKRSSIMRAVPSSDTEPERLLRSALWALGLRGWRKNNKRIQGSPDVVFSKQRVAIFVDGCYWHGCPRCCRKP